MTLKKTALSLTIIVLTLSACSKGGEHNGGSYADEQMASAASIEVVPSEEVLPATVLPETETPIVQPKGALQRPQTHQNSTNQAEELSALDTELTNPALANKKLIVNGSLRFEVADVRQTASYIQVLASSHGGYVASESVHNELGRSEEVAIGDGKFRQMTEYTPTASLTVRIPKKEVTTFLQNLQTRIEFLIASEMDAKDASLEVKKAQLEAQIAALKVGKLEHLENDNAHSAGMINAQVAVADKAAQTQLSQMHAQLSEQAIEDQVALATLRLDFFEHKKLHLRTTASLESQLNKEKRANFSGRLKANLSVGWAYAVELFLWLTKLWVVVLMVGFVWVGLPRLMAFIKNRQKNKPAARPIIHVPANPPKNDDFTK